eukprot:6307860-Amphidinium_carterae.1
MQHTTPSDKECNICLLERTSQCTATKETSLTQEELERPEVAMTAFAGEHRRKDQPPRWSAMITLNLSPRPSTRASTVNHQRLP